jgi:Lar family restriction alleviation protein
MTAKDTPAALLPCPFCGGAVAVEKVFASDQYESYGYWSIECTAHEAQTGLFCGVHADSEDEAIAAWNRRAPDEAGKPVFLPSSAKGNTSPDSNPQEVGKT